MISNSVRSSLPLQFLLITNGPYAVVFVVLMLSLLFYKTTYLPYAFHVKVCDFLLILMFAPVEALRLYWGRRGNLTENPPFITFSLALNLAVIAVCVYWAIFQSYILFLEFIIVCIEGVFVIAESLFALILIAVLSRPAST
ncbi:hypothetical protein AB6A40_009196 [Gnathostoma spinigerum]|uniref:Transmembrane protein 216 n=1 Tax=Gnathostoma spinigerum TaxID=75299 RepID=A0ABD6F064_9BILA